MKESLHPYIPDYTQLKSSNLAKGYKGLMEYLMSLRTYFINQYPAYTIGSFYQGYMDMSYFPITPTPFKSLQLKFGLVYNHEKNSFEIWLLGRNKKVQRKYWELLKNQGLVKYEISKTPQDSVIDHVLVENPDFNDLDQLTQILESKTINFIENITKVLA